jgi:hypothetical protein
MNKPTILLMLGVSFPALMAANEIVTPATSEKSISAKIKQATVEKVSATRETSAEQVTDMQKQIADLQKQLAEVAKQVKDHDQKAKATQHAKESQAANMAMLKEEPKKEDAPQFEKGYMAVPGTSMGVKIGGLVKVDMVYDGKSNTSEQTAVQRVPYDLTVNQDQGQSWNKHFYMHAKQTKLRIESVAKNSSGRDAKAFIEGDFFGTTVFGDTAVNGATLGSTTYQFRLRHAVLSYAGLEAGHTTTTFHLDEALLPSVDLNGITSGYGRHALIRYTHKLGCFAVTAAAEHSRADYVTFANTANTLRYTYLAQDSGVNLSKPERPDFILKAKYSFDNGSTIGLSGLYRDLQIKNNTGDNRSYKATGQGINLAAKIMTFGKSFLTGGVTAGKGLGWYILEANGRSAFLDRTSADINARTYKAIPMTMFWAGYCQVWNPQWQTSVGVSRTNLGTKSFNDDAQKTTTANLADPGIDRTFNKFLINTIYMPEENLQFGLEYFFLQRKSVNTNRGTGVNASNGVDSHTGTGHRFQFGASYKF